jgi:hypothetical protein
MTDTMDVLEKFSREMADKDGTSVAAEHVALLMPMLRKLVNGSEGGNGLDAMLAGAKIHMCLAAAGIDSVEGAYSSMLATMTDALNAAAVLRRLMREWGVDVKGDW